MRRQRPTLALILPALAFAATARGSLADEPEVRSRAQTHLTFEDAKLGLFVEWGVSSLLGKGASVMDDDKLPISEYEKLPPRFNPSAFDPETWVKTARSAGARYLIVAAKHHDGFCMFESKLTRYDVVDATPYGKDPLKAIAAACRKHGLPLVVSYSLLDWHHPDYAPRGRTGKSSGRDDKGDWSRYVAYYQGQVRELCTHYGPLAGIWLEGAGDKPEARWDLEATYKMIRTEQPGALIANDHQGQDWPLPDVLTLDQEPRQDHPQEPTEPPPIREVHQPCNAKSLDETIRSLANPAGCWAKPLLLIVTPRPDGAFSAQAAERLAGVGKWLEKQGASIYGTLPGPIRPQDWGVSTRDGGAGQPTAVYLHVLQPVREIRLPGGHAARSMPRQLGATELLPMGQDRKQAVVKLPEPDPSQPDTVIVLTPRMLGR